MKRSPAETAAKFDALQRALNTIDALPELLKAYEQTGDHNHGGRRGALGVGEYCPGGDCNVTRARKVIAALNLTTTPKES